MQYIELFSIHERSSGSMFSDSNKKEGLAKTEGNNPVKPVIIHLQEISSKRYTAFIVIKKINEISLKTLLWFISYVGVSFASS